MDPYTRAYLRGLRIKLDKQLSYKKKGGYEKSQAVSQVNNCGNKFMPENVWCQNTASQIQGEDNNAALSSAQGDQRSGGGTPPDNGGGTGD